MPPNKLKQAQEEEQALPTAPFSYLRATEEAKAITESPEERERKKEESSIASLKTDKRYKLLEKEIMRRAESLKKLLDLDLSKMTDEEIGKRFVVANFGAEQLLGIIDYVNQHATAISAAEASQGEANASSPA